MPVLRRLHSCSIVCCFAIASPDPGGASCRTTTPLSSIPRSSEIGSLTRRGLLAAAGVGGLTAAFGLSPAQARGALPESWLSESAGTVTLGSIRRERRDPGLARGHEAFTQEVGHQGQDQHLRPQHVPGAHQQLPAGPPAGRLHVVRRLPDAVLRGEGPRDADRRRLADADAADAAGLQGRLDGPRRAPVLRPEQELPVGRLLRKSLWKANGYRPRRRGPSSSRSPRR